MSDAQAAASALVNQKRSAEDEIDESPHRQCADKPSSHQQRTRKRRDGKPTALEPALS